MTCLEKWKLEHGDNRESDLHPALDEMCPSDFKYAPDPVDEFGRPDCCQMTCKQCWEREVAEETVDKPEPRAIPLVNSTPISDEAMEEVVEDLKTGVPTILDSGDRTQFESGAVRDMRAGKGRCDLLPLEVVANYICDSDDDTDLVLWNMNMFLKTNSTSYLYSALSYFDEHCWDNCYTMILETAKHYEEGAKKYGPDNWRKSIPTWCYIDSAIRHYLKWLRGDVDEPHDRSFCWNVLCCIWEVDYGAEWRKARDERLNAN